MKDYYGILGVEKNATPEEIKKAYRQLALQLHPDTPGGDKAEKEAKFKEITEAYGCLSDPEKKEKYDNNGPFSQFAGFGNMGGFGFNPFRQQSNVPPGDRMTAGDNIVVELGLTLEEGAKGIDKEIEVERFESCPDCAENPGLKKGAKRTTCDSCSGRGVVITERVVQENWVTRQVVSCYKCNGKGKTCADDNKCPTCKGLGMATKKKTFSLKIPKGAMNDGTMIMNGEGHVGQNGGPSGNVFVRIRLEEHDIFGMNENDIVMELPISIVQASIGDKVKVPTVAGEILEIEIPAGTDSGEIFQQKGHGYPVLNSKRSGDFILVTKICAPKNITAEEKIIFEKLKEEENKKPIADNKIGDYITRLEKEKPNGDNGVNHPCL